MASPNVWPAGLNLTGTVFAGGPSLLQYTGDYFSGSIQWVDTISGNNANAGTNPKLPVQTLNQALTNSAANGLIVIGAGSSETYTLPAVMATAGLTVVGCGSGTTRPRYTANLAGTMFPMTAQMKIHNMYFPASGTAGSIRVDFGAPNCEIKDCYFECGAADTSPTVQIDFPGAGNRVRDCTFLATASRPAIAISSTVAFTDSLFENVTIDGGSYGWSTNAVVIGTTAPLRMMWRNLTLRNGSNFTVTVTGTSYQLFGVSNDATSEVVIAA